MRLKEDERRNEDKRHKGLAILQQLCYPNPRTLRDKSNNPRIRWEDHEGVKRYLAVFTFVFLKGYIKIITKKKNNLNVSLLCVLFFFNEILGSHCIEKYTEIDDMK